MKEYMSELYGYVFHYNHFTELWNAIPREKYNQYWDNDGTQGVFQSKSIDTLIEMIIKGDKFIKTIKK